jgi:hypothetical protein
LRVQHDPGDDFCPVTEQVLHATGNLDDRWIVDDPDTLLAAVDQTMACQTGRKRA